jgi:hypothetical protein
MSNARHNVKKDMVIAFLPYAEVMKIGGTR